MVLTDPSIHSAGEAHSPTSRGASLNDQTIPDQKEEIFEKRDIKHEGRQLVSTRDDQTVGAGESYPT